MKPLPATLLAFGAGCANALSFAPLGWWPLCLLSFAALFALWRADSRAAAAWHGFVYGLGMFGVGISWIQVSIHNFGGMPPVLAGLCVLLLVLAMSWFPALAGFVQGCARSRARTGRAATIRLAAIMPSVWLLTEWLRGWLFTGFPWLTTGYAMLDTPIAGFAPLGGVYLVSLLTLTTVGALSALLGEKCRGNALLAFLLGLIWLGAWQLSATPWTQARDGAISVAIVQNNVPVTLKWDGARSARIVREYLAQSARHRDVDVVVWPEAAVPDYLDRLPANFHRQIRAHPADFIFGVLTRAAAGDGNGNGAWRYYNSIAALSGHDRISLYHKQHLVPFGEFLPLPWLRPLLDMMNIPMSDFAHWRQPQSALAAAGNLFAASICYEDAFPQEWRRQVPASGILLNVSEDMWFGDSLAPHQRLQMARFRSLESGRYMIRASNNGLSSVIDWRGRVVAVAPQFVKTVVTASVQPRAGVTPYTAFGDWPALIVAVALGALGTLGLLFAERELR